MVRLKDLLTLPAAPVVRLRLFALGLALLSIAALLAPTLSSDGGVARTVATCLGLVALAAHWCIGYRRERFHRLSDALEAVPIALAGSLIAAPEFLAPLFVVIFRSLYGGIAQATFRLLIYSAVVVVNTGGPIDGSGGRVTGLVVVVIFAQALLGSLQKQGRGEEAFRLLAGAKDYAIFMLDPDGRIKSWNRGAERVLGFSESDVMGQHLSLLGEVDGSEGSTAAQRLAQATREGSTEFRGWRTRKDGTRLFAEAVLTALTDQRGRLVGFSEITRDKTEQRLADTALERSEERLRRVLSGAPIVLWALEPDGTLSLCEGKDLPGIPLDGTRIGQDFERVFGDCPDLMELNRRALEGAPAVGTVTWAGVILETSCSPVREGGRLIGVIGLAADVTEHVVMEQRENELEAELAHAQRAESIGRLAGGIAHDFNNLLAVVINHAAFIKQELGEEHPLHEDMEEITKAADRAAALTRQLLLFSRRQVPSPVVLEINPLIEDMQRMLERVLGRDVQLIAGLEPDLPPVLADRTQLEQVIVNLVVNARDAMANGALVTVETDNLVDEQGTDWVRITVGDTGCGMAPEVLANAFDPFYTTKGSDGTGLGLATVDGIVKGCKGRSASTRSRASEPCSRSACRPRASRSRMAGHWLSRWVRRSSRPAATDDERGPDL